jgi:hypothetical protein
LEHTHHRNNRNQNHNGGYHTDDDPSNRPSTQRRHRAAIFHLWEAAVGVATDQLNDDHSLRAPRVFIKIAVLKRQSEGTLSGVLSCNPHNTGVIEHTIHDHP